MRFRTQHPDADLRNPARPEFVASSMSGVTIFSVMSVRTVNVGITMKSMNPAGKNKYGFTFELMDHQKEP